MVKTDQIELERDWVLIHSMGKVGSYAVYKAVEATRQFRALHTHQLNRKTLEAYCKTTEKTPGHIKHSFEFLDVVQPDDRVKLIIGIREPMSRNMSAFFENLNRFGLVDDGVYDAAELIKIFTEKYAHQVPVRWFNDQIEQPLGLKLFDRDWEIPRRAVIGRFEIFIDRLEDSNEHRERSLREFLKCPDLQLRHLNVGQEKSYSELYASFKERFRPSTKMLDMLYDSDYVRCFYSLEEREAMRNRWC